MACSKCNCFLLDHSLLILKTEIQPQLLVVTSNTNTQINARTRLHKQPSAWPKVTNMTCITRTDPDFSVSGSKWKTWTVSVLLEHARYTESMLNASEWIATQLQRYFNAIYRLRMQQWAANEGKNINIYFLTFDRYNSAVLPRWEKSCRGGRKITKQGTRFERRQSVSAKFYRYIAATYSNATVYCTWALWNLLNKVVSQIKRTHLLVTCAP